jgi:nucleotide-binding universal stress UspA family protein
MAAGARGASVRSMPRPIIAAVDPRGNDISPAALGAMLAHITRAPLIVAGAYPVDRAIDDLYPEYARALRLDAERALRQAGGTVVAVAAQGSPARALHELAERERARMLVIGPSHRSTPGRAAPGAVTDRLLHGAPCPVAVAPADFPRDAPPPQTIGVAFADTPDAHAALAGACELAARARAVVRVLTVAEPLDWLVTGTLDGVALADADRARIARAETTLRRGVDAVPHALCGGGETLSGRPSAALAAASGDLDLLVCGSRGYGPVHTLLVGSTSHALVRSAACPVLVVPRDCGQRAAEAA